MNYKPRKTNAKHEYETKIEIVEHLKYGKFHFSFVEYNFKKWINKFGVKQFRVILVASFEKQQQRDNKTSIV